MKVHLHKNSLSCALEVCALRFDNNKLNYSMVKIQFQEKHQEENFCFHLYSCLYFLDFYDRYASF